MGDLFAKDGFWKGGLFFNGDGTACGSRDEGVLDGKNAESNVFYFIDACFIEIVEVGNIIGYDGANKVFFIGTMLRVVVIATDNDCCGEFREAFHKVNTEFNP